MRRRVGVAVDAPFPECDRQERATSAEHGCPVGDVVEAVDDEPPGSLSDVVGGRAGEGEPAYGRVHAVCADDEVVAAARAVGEDHLRRPAVFDAGH
jgi:hypothetical protein